MEGGDLEGRTAHGRRRQRSSSRAPTPTRSAEALIDAIFPREAVDASAAARSSGPLGLEADLQTVLAGGVRRIASQTAATRACAWVLQPDGKILSAAGHQKEGVLAAPNIVAFEHLQELPGASDLGATNLDPILANLAADTGLTAAVPIRLNSPHHAPDVTVILLLGGPDDEAGLVRPRTLAVLDEVAEQLGRSLATVGSVARLGELDSVIQRLDRLAALGDLMAEIAHEVRNPLVSVKTFLQLLPDRIDDPEFVGHYRELVSEEVSRLERLLDSVLMHARPHSNAEPDSAGVAETFDAIVGLLLHRARERQVTLQRVVDNRVDAVAIHPDLLRQVLLNLVINALDATPAQGQVTLRASPLPRVNGRFVELVVEDDGKGVPADQRELIFEAFHSSQPDRPGGLGLAISRRLIEEGGGEIVVGDHMGGGARFLIRLPAAQARNLAP